MIKVIHGDSKEILKTLNFTDKTIIVTDPLFNISYGYKTYKDKMPEQDYWKMLKDMFQDRKCAVIHYSEQLHRLSIELQTAPTKTVSWVYNSNTAKQHREIAFYNIQPDFKQVGQAYKNPTDKRIAKRIEEGKTAKLYDWWNINQVKNVSKEKTEHPCQMPLEVMCNIIGILPKDAEIVEPFGGSGTTAEAIKIMNEKQNANRTGIIIEIDEVYVEIIKNRIK
jgi:DNA modification methylase